MNIRRFIPAGLGALAILGVALPNAAVAAVNGESVTNVRDATASYNDPAVALAGGYDLLTDSADIACIDQPGEGAMGIHYVKGALVQAGKVDPARPQALVYWPPWSIAVCPPIRPPACSGIPFPLPPLVSASPNAPSGAASPGAH